MVEKEQSKEQGFGKYNLINDLKSKYKSVFDEAEEGRLFSNTLYLEGIHFNLVYFPLRHLSYKSVINSIADLYCRGLEPVNIRISLGLSARFSKGDIESLLEGVALACERYTLKISSLDISSSLTGLTISMASSGRERNPFRVGEPMETDLLCVTGDLGAAYLGLQILERERRVFEDTGGGQPELHGFEYVIGRQLKPDLKTVSMEKIKEHGIITGIRRTVRDGLASELLHLSTETGLACRVYHDRLPIALETASAAKELGLEPLIAALNGGDDFEYVFTVPVTEHEKIEGIEGINIIGHMMALKEGNSLVLPDGSLAALRAQGWEGEV